MQVWLSSLFARLQRNLCKQEHNMCREICLKSQTSVYICGSDNEIIEN